MKNAGVCFEVINIAIYKSLREYGITFNSKKPNYNSLRSQRNTNKVRKLAAFHAVSLFIWPRFRDEFKERLRRTLKHSG